MRALVTGATGQDGWYLCDLLSTQGHDVYGLVSDDDVNELPPGVSKIEGDMRDSDSLRRALDTVDPEQVYNLASISSVAQSWSSPELVADVNGVGVVRLLAAVRARHEEGGRGARVIQASSAEMFGDAPAPQDERTPISPRTPYGAAKAFGHHAISAYRAAGEWACSIVLFNHESPRRPETFVTRKITRAVAQIAEGESIRLSLGNLASRRDWGYAGDYVRAMVMAAARDAPTDYVIATGVSRSIEDFVHVAFAHVGIEAWRDHIDVDASLSRPVDASEQRGNAQRARHELGWQPTLAFAQLVGLMVDADREAVRTRSVT